MAQWFKIAILTFWLGWLVLPSEGYATNPALHISSCLTPTNLVSDSVGFAGIRMKWNSMSGSTGYDLRWRIAGNTNWNTVNNIADTFRLVSNLDPGISYEFMVRSRCANNTTSAWSSLVSATTLGCNTPQQFATDSIGFAGIRLRWRRFVSATGYDLRWRIVGNQNWNTINNIADTVRLVSNLDPGISYEFMVRSRCGTNAYSAWSSVVTATTPVCNTPQNFVVDSVGYGGIRLRWHRFISATGYDLRWRIVGNQNWNTINNIADTVRLVNNLNPGITYEFMVRSRCGTNAYSAWSSGVTATTSACNTPQNFVVDSVAYASIRVRWFPVPSANYYQLRWRLQGQQNWQTVNNIQDTFYRVHNLTQDTPYEVMVRSECGNEYSGWSNTLSTRTLECPIPINLVADSIGFGGIRLRWQTVGRADEYQLRWRNISQPNWNTINNIQDTFRLLSNLTPGTTYQWMIKALCGDGQSAWGDTLTASTLFCNPPTALRADTIANGRIFLRWNRGGQATTYQVSYRRLGSPSWTTVSNVIDTFRWVNNLQPGFDYQFRVRSRCMDEYSVWTDTLTVQTNSCQLPFNFSTDSITFSSVRLNWTTVQGAQGYQIRWKRSDNNSWQSRNVANNLTNYIIRNLAPGVSYQFRIRTDCDGAYSAWSDTLSVTLNDCPPPPILSYQYLYSNEIKLIWTPILPASSYHLRWRLQGNPTWTNLNNLAGTERIIANLQPASAYEFQIRTNCTNAHSAWSNIYLFRTVDPNALAVSYQDARPVFEGLVANAGQVATVAGNPSNQTIARADASQISIFVQPTKLHLVFHTFVEDSSLYRSSLHPLEQYLPEGHLRLSRLDLELVGANPNPTVDWLDTLAMPSHYYLPQTGANGLTDVKSYGTLRLRDVYPGIDWLVKVDREQKEFSFDFVVNRGADPGQIQFRYAGAESIDPLSNGHYQIRSKLGVVEHANLYAYQPGNFYFKQAVDVEPVLVNNVFQFNTLSFSNQKDLILSYALKWRTAAQSTLANLEQIQAMDFDHQGNLLAVFNSLQAADLLPEQTGEVHKRLTGDVKVVKYLSGHDQKPLWQSYYGGGDREQGFALAIGSGNESYVAGYTQSTNIPVSLPQTNVQTGGQNGLLYTLDADGKRLWSRTVTANTFNGIRGCAVDDSANVYVSGYESVHPVCLFPDSIAHPSNAFIAKYDPSGQPEWLHTFGDSAHTEAYDVSVRDTHLVMVGKSSSPCLPASATGYQPQCNGQFDGFVVRYDLNGELQRSTYLGGTAGEVVRSVEIAPDLTSVSVGGNTKSYNLPLANAFRPTFGGGGSDGFIARLSLPLHVLQLSSYYGGTGYDGISEIRSDWNRHIYGIGSTGSTDLTTRNAYQPTLSGSMDGFLFQLSPADTLAFSSYTGTAQKDVSHGLTVYPNGKVALGIGSAQAMATPIRHHYFQPSATNVTFSATPETAPILSINPYPSVPINLTTIVSMSNATGSAVLPVPGCNGWNTGTPDRWARMVVPDAVDALNFNIVPTNNTHAAIPCLYRGTDSGNLTPHLCWSATTNNNYNTTVNNLTAGENLWLRVGEQNNNLTANFTLNVTSIRSLGDVIKSPVISYPDIGQPPQTNEKECSPGVKCEYTNQGNNANCLKSIPLQNGIRYSNCNSPCRQCWPAPPNSGNNCSWGKISNAVFFKYTVTDATPRPFVLEVNAIQCREGNGNLYLGMYRKCRTCVACAGGKNCDLCDRMNSGNVNASVQQDYYLGCAKGTGTVSLHLAQIENGEYLVVVDGGDGAQCCFEFNNVVIGSERPCSPNCD